MRPGTGTTQLVASTLRLAGASRHRAWKANPRSIDSMEFPSGRGPARLNICPREMRVETVTLVVPSVIPGLTDLLSGVAH
jgi:hypothetical protein